MEAIRCTNASSARDRRRRTEGANAADQRRDDVDNGRLSSSPVHHPGREPLLLRQHGEGRAAIARHRRLQHEREHDHQHGQRRRIRLRVVDEWGRTGGGRRVPGVRQCAVEDGGRGRTSPGCGEGVLMRWRELR